MRRYVLGFLLCLLALIFLAFMMGMLAGRATAQEPSTSPSPGAHTHGHMKYHMYYQNWRQPGNPDASCCNARTVSPEGDVSGDCYPTQYQLIHGTWWAKLAPEDGGKWIEIPQHFIIHERNPDPSGVTGHICWNHYTNALLCAVPPTGAL